ncbi:MAG: hypothetical protein HYR73_01690 [Candidatus Eisenbacteria bacterium]|nr:hypothetical protein [Candidatus Eisenbacteria bacterium]
MADVMRTAAGGEDLRVVVRAGEPCRLARGLAERGSIDDQIAARAVDLAQVFARRASGLGAGRVLIAATAALRDAVNGEQVAAAIAERTGLPVRILSGDDEARLVYRSVVHGLGFAARGQACVVFDLGGGSTEVVSGVGLAPGRWTSLPFGAVSLTDRFLHSDPPVAPEIDALREAVREILMHNCAYMPQRAPLLAGVGGTVTVLAAMDRGLQSYDPQLLEGWSIAATRLEQLIAGLVSTPRNERGAWPVMGEGRADIVAAGALAVSELIRRFPAGGLMCSTQGLRYGLVRLAADEAASQPDPGESPGSPEGRS